MNADSRVLVTGAAGFIGRWSVPALLKSGFKVHAVHSPRCNRELPVELHGATIHAADLLDESAVESLLGAVKPTHLLHFAWIATPGVYWQSPDNFRWLAAGQHLLLRFRAHGGVRVVMAGSCAEYDWSRVGVCAERTSPLADEAASAPSTYAQCKITLQKSLAEFSVHRHLSTAWGRVFLQYGPGEHPDRLVPSVILNLLNDREAPCTHGRQVRSFLHVADVGDAFEQLLNSHVEGAVNIGSDERIAVADLIEGIAREIGRPDLVRLGARIAAGVEPDLLVPDIRRLREELNWRPAFSLNHGIADTIAWWRKHPHSMHPP